MNIETIEAAVAAALQPEGAAWLQAARQQIATDRSARARLFPAVARKCGTGHLFTDYPELIGWTVADAVRTLLLIGATTDDVTAIYHYGDTNQRRAVLRALPLLDLGDTAIPLVVAALRSNDRQLIAAAVGRYAAEHLPVEPWREAVLTCARLAVPLAWVTDLERRVDGELVEMLRGHAAQRIAAGRPVPVDVTQIIDSAHDDQSSERGEGE